MVRPRSKDSVVDPHELELREMECALEQAFDLFATDPDAREFVAAAKEAMTYKEEAGLTHWQSVAAYSKQHPEEWKRLCSDPRMQWISKIVDHRFGVLFQLNAWQPRDTVDTFDSTVHDHAHAVAKAAHDIVWLTTQKQGRQHVSVERANAAIRTRATSRIYEPAYFAKKQVLVGEVVTSSAPVIDRETGEISETERTTVGPPIQAGPIFN